MPDLGQSLQGRDLGHLKIIAELWGFEFSAPDARIGLKRLIPLMTDTSQLVELIEALPENARQAFDELRQQGGRLPWALFSRRYGGLREMGQARRDRERPYRDGRANACEALWYRGLIGRTFFDNPEGPVEFAYIPDELLEGLPIERLTEAPRPLGRPATPAEKGYPLLATDRLLDDACTLLAGLRLGLGEEKLAKHLICAPQSPFPVSAGALQELLHAAGLIDKKGTPLPEAARKFLEASRGEALGFLARAWLRSPNFNELRMLPGVGFEGVWRNDPLAARRSILDFLSTIPGAMPGDASEERRPYWSTTAFISAIQQTYPDFQRPGGDYDSWFLVDEASGSYLRGFENWERVEGRLIRFFISGPLHWLAILDLSLADVPESGKPQTATGFRFSGWAQDLLSLKPGSNLTEEQDFLIANSDGRLSAPRLLARSARYQIARFCEWGGFTQENYRYRITPHSLEQARGQGLTVKHLLSLLTKHCRAVPPSLVTALSNWEEQGSEARLERATVLRVRRPEIITALRGSKWERFLGEPLGPAAVIVHPGAWEKIASALAEMGYLSEVSIEEE